MEEFKDIQEYEGLYQVSNLGRVKSLKDTHGGYREKLLKPIKNNYGYLYVGLYKNRKKKIFSIHRLVAEAFIPNPNNYPIINHKDENPLNNNVDNLEFCTYQYNNIYGTVIQRRKANTDWKELARKLSKHVLQFTKDGDFVNEWVSTMECGRNGYNSGHVAECCNGKRKTHKGFIWRYKE